MNHALLLQMMGFLGLRIRYWLIIIVVIIIILVLAYYARSRAR